MSAWYTVSTPPLPARSSPREPSPASTWCAVDSRARTCPPPARAPDSTASDRGSGGKSGGSFAIFDRATSSWRTSQPSLFGGWTSYSERWPSSGTMRSGRCSVHLTWALPTDGAESPSSPTYPTPTRARSPGGGGREGGDGLSATMRAWPTPTRTDAAGSRRVGLAPGSHPGTTLTDAVWQGGTTGRLNPAWVELLMGFPAGWTALAGRPTCPASPLPRAPRRHVWRLSETP